MADRGQRKGRASHADIVNDLMNKLEKAERDLAVSKRETETFKNMCQELEKNNDTCMEVILDDAKILSKKTVKLFDRDRLLEDYKLEIDRKNEETECLKKNQNELRCEKAKLENEKRKVEATNDLLIKTNDQLQGRLQKLQETYEELECTHRETITEKDDLMLRLSKIAGAYLTHNIPNIADLSDTNRPTKLAMKFSEMYDNQWTDAFETLNMADETATIQCLLNILKATSRHCVEITTQQSSAMLKMLTNVQVKYTRPSISRDSQHSNPEGDSELSKHIAEMSVTYNDPHTSSQEPPPSVKTSGNGEDCRDHCAELSNVGREKCVDDTVCSEETVKIPYVDRNKEKMEGTHFNGCIPKKTKVMSDGRTVFIEQDFSDKLSTSDLKNIGDIRKQLQQTMKEDIIKIVTSVVKDELNIEENNTLSEFIQECASVCWEMRLHDPPLHLDFIGVDDALDSSVYKAYTTSGKMLDYLVWPPLYLHENGPLLNKGVAQGKYNTV